LDDKLHRGLYQYKSYSTIVAANNDRTPPAGCFNMQSCCLLYAFNIPPPPQADGIVKQKGRGPLQESAHESVSVDACRPRFESLRNKMIRPVMVLKYCVPQPKTF